VSAEHDITQLLALIVEHEVRRFALEVELHEALSRLRDLGPEYDAITTTVATALAAPTNLDAGYPPRDRGGRI